MAAEFALHGTDAAAAERAGIAVIFDPFHLFDDVRIRRQRPFDAEIQMGALPVLDRRVPHLHGGLIQAAGPPLSQQNFFNHSVHGHLRGQYAHDDAEIGCQRTGKEGGLPLNPAVALPAELFTKPS